ncbi:hypothetical protein D3C76_1649610 [compost metagenome]
MQTGFSCKLGITHYSILYVPGNADLFIHDFLARTCKLCNRNDQRDMQRRIQADRLGGSLQRCGHHRLAAGGMHVEHVYTKSGDALSTAPDSIRDIMHFNV